MRKLLSTLLALAAMLGLVAGCATANTSSAGGGSPGGGSTGVGPGGGSSPGTSAGGVAGTVASTQPGTVELRVTDAPRSDNITEVWITVSQIQIHEAKSKAPDNQPDEDNNGWITANITGQNPFDLLALKNLGGLQAVLGGAILTSGNYTQIRLGIQSARVKINGVLKDATVPSGKLKLTEPFEIASGNLTALLFDFDADKSVNVDGQSGKITIDPVIKLSAEKPRDPDKGAQDTIKITTPSLQDGKLNTAYDAELHAVGGSVPYKWSIAAGSLPSGLGINSATGVISGSPTVSGNFTFTAKVSDNSVPAKTDTRQYTITVSP